MTSADAPDLPAGDFTTWLGDIQAAIRGERAADVPCGSCSACCTSSQFVHIAPDETDALSHIPKALLFPAPGLPRGHVLLGYDDRGHCPLLSGGKCTIYDHRPRTCRTYDCRVFPAAGLDAADDDKPLIAERARRWRFSYDDPAGVADHEAVKAEAGRLSRQPGAPSAAIARAVQAVQRPADWLPGGKKP